MKLMKKEKMEKKISDDDCIKPVSDEKKVIAYMHGFGSSGQSGTVKHLRKILPQFSVLAPDIPINPVEALSFLRDYCEQNHPDIIIGTSMGAMYAMQMYNYKRICVNPALRMSELTDILKPGTFEYFQPTEAGETIFTITRTPYSSFVRWKHIFSMELTTTTACGAGGSLATMTRQ